MSRFLARDMNVKNMHPVFQSNDPHGNIVFNFRPNVINDLAPFAEGYHKAGKRLAKIFEDSPGYADFDGYPIFFLYRHALELYMKAIVYRGDQLLQLLDKEKLDTSKLFTCHRLSELLKDVKRVLDGIGWAWDLETEYMRNYEEFEELIKGIEEIDPGSYNFRYPTNPKGQAALPRHTIINPIGFSRKMDPVLDMLSAAVLGLHVQFDATAEAKFEHQGTIE
jgi:hypothetical protein